jgi:hypothetical protein
MMRDLFSSVPRLVLGCATAALLAACGGSQEPAESPEATPASQSDPASAPATDTPGDGQHTMPDGTVMEGDHHGEHGASEGAPSHGDPQ